jgi:hypothetical protein
MDGTVDVDHGGPLAYVPLVVEEHFCYDLLTVAVTDPSYPL